MDQPLDFCDSSGLFLVGSLPDCNPRILYVFDDHATLFVGSCNCMLFMISWKAPRPMNQCSRLINIEPRGFSW